MRPGWQDQQPDFGALRLLVGEREAVLLVRAGRIHAPGQGGSDSSGIQVVRQRQLSAGGRQES